MVSLVFAALTIPIVAFSAAPGGAAMVDTGGMTESRSQHALDFASLYRGLGVDYAIGVDYLAKHAVSAGAAGTPTHVVRLDVREAKKWTLAFLSCTIGGQQYRMLLDTAALAWPSKGASKPQGVVYLSTSSFEALRQRRPAWPYRAGGRWIVDAQGRFVEAKSLVATTTCGGITNSHSIVVERTDDSTYRYIRQLLGVTAAGDVSLAAFDAAGVRIDFSGKTLTTY